MQSFFSIKRIEMIVFRNFRLQICDVYCSQKLLLVSLRKWHQQSNICFHKIELIRNYENEKIKINMKMKHEKSHDLKSRDLKRTDSCSIPPKD